MKYFNVLEDIYKKVISVFPFKSKSELHRFKARYEKCKVEIKEIESDKRFYMLLKIFLNNLKNTHTRLVDYPGRVFYKPRDLEVVKNGKNLLLIRNKKIEGKILSVDGFDAQKRYYAEIKKIKCGSLTYRRSLAMKRFLGCEKNIDLYLSLEKNGICEILTCKREILKNETGDIFYCFDRNIAYIKIESWTHKKKFKARIDNYFASLHCKNIKGLIIDLRANQGGDSRVADLLLRHLIKTKTRIATVYSRDIGGKKEFSLKKEQIELLPQKPYLSIPIVLLVNSQCMSTTEYFIAAMKDNGLAIVIGENTAGGSGNPIKYKICFEGTKIGFQVSTWLFRRRNGLWLEGRGIKPDICVKNKFDDFLEEVDCVLKKGFEVLSENK